MGRRKTMMILSTARDLLKHREEVRKACERAGFEPREIMEVRRAPAAPSTLAREAKLISKIGGKRDSVSCVRRLKPLNFASRPRPRKSSSYSFVRTISPMTPATSGCCALACVRWKMATRLPMSSLKSGRR
jgi:hypothetical protein